MVGSCYKTHTRSTESKTPRAACHMARTAYRRQCAGELDSTARGKHAAAQTSMRAVPFSRAENTSDAKHTTHRKPAHSDVKGHLDLSQAVDAHEALALGGLNQGAVILVLGEPHLKVNRRHTHTGS